MQPPPAPPPHIQNLREAIATYRARMLEQDSEKKRATVMAVCLEYLERYYMLLAFTSYLTWHKFNPAHPGAPRRQSGTARGGH